LVTSSVLKSKSELKPSKCSFVRQESNCLKVLGIQKRITVDRKAIQML